MRSLWIIKTVTKTRMIIYNQFIHLTVLYSVHWVSSGNSRGNIHNISLFWWFSVAIFISKSRIVLIESVDRVWVGESSWLHKLCSKACFGMEILPSIAVISKHLEKCGLYINGKSNGNHLLMQQTVNIINSCFCMFKYRLQSLTFHLKTHEKMSYSCCESAEQYEGGYLTFSLCWHLEGYGWTTVGAGGRWACRLIAQSVARW